MSGPVGRRPRLPPRLLALSPGALEPEGVDTFVRAAAAALEAGLRGILLREPRLPERAFLRLACALRELCDACAPPLAWFGVHDRAHVALLSSADGLHLGFRSLRPEELRAWLGSRLCLGFSAHVHDERARWMAADYLFLGPLLATPSKRLWEEPVGFAAAQEFLRNGPSWLPPVWGIGGLRPEHGCAVLASGARGLAVLSGIFGAKDPAAATRAYLDALARDGCAS